jgi:hypothetical protein
MLYLVVIWSLLLLLLMIDDVSPTAMLTLSMKNKGSIKYKSSKLICNFFKEILYVLVSFLTDEVVAPYGPRLSSAGESQPTAEQHLLFHLMHPSDFSYSRRVDTHNGFHHVKKSHVQSLTLKMIG